MIFKSIIPQMLQNSIQDIVVGCGSTNPPGVNVRLYMVNKEEILTFPTKKAYDPAIAGESVKLDGEIILVPNSKWATIDIVTDTGEVKDGIVGTDGSKSIESFLDGVIPTTSASVLEWMERNANNCMVVLAKEKSGIVRVLGTKESPAKLESGEATTGKATGDIHGLTFSIKSTTGYTASIYEGTIDLDATT